MTHRPMSLDETRMIYVDQIPVMNHTRGQAAHHPRSDLPDIVTPERLSNKERDTVDDNNTKMEVQEEAPNCGRDTCDDRDTGTGVHTETGEQEASLDGGGETCDDRNTEMEIHTESGVEDKAPFKGSVTSYDRDTHTGVQEAAPDGGWGWFVMIGTLLTNIIVWGIARSSGVFYLRFMRYYGASAVVTSWVVSTGFMLTLLLGPLASALCNRFTVRTVVMLGATLSTLGMFLSAISPDIYFLYFSFGILVGFGYAFAFNSSTIILGQYFVKRRSLSMGIASSGSPFSACVFPFILEMLWSHYGFSGTFLILGAVNSHLYISAAFFRPLQLNIPMIIEDRLVNLIESTTTDVSGRSETKQDNHSEKEESRPTFLSDHQSRCKHYQSICKKIYLRIHKRIFELNRKQGNTSGVLLDLSLLKNFPFLCVCIQQFLFTGIITNMFIYLPAFAIEKGIKPTSANYLLSVMDVADGFSRIFLSMFLDLERVRPYRLIIYNLNIFVAAFMSLLLPFLTKFWMFYVVIGLTGATFGIYISQKSVICVDVLGVEHLTSSFGLLLAFDGVAVLLSPTFGGLVKDYLGSYDVAFYISSVGTMSAWATLAAGNWWLYRRRRNGYDAF